MPLKDKDQYSDLANNWDNVIIDDKTVSYNLDFYQVIGNDLNGKKILDIGCGSGYDLKQLRVNGVMLYGIDCCQEMVDEARLNVPSATVSLGSFQHIPYKNECFDMVISKWALQTVDDIATCYEEIARVLKPGGRSVLLATHPMRQFMERKKQQNNNYFDNAPVTSTFFDGKVTVTEPAHTLNDYLSPALFKHFDLKFFKENTDPASEKIEGNTYPTYLLLDLIKRP